MPLMDCWGDCQIEIQYEAEVIERTDTNPVKQVIDDYYNSNEGTATQKWSLSGGWYKYIFGSF